MGKERDVERRENRECVRHGVIDACANALGSMFGADVGIVAIYSTATLFYCRYKVSVVLLFVIRKFVKFVVELKLEGTCSGAELPHANRDARQEVRESLSQNIATSVAPVRPRNPHTSTCSVLSASQIHYQAVYYGASCHREFSRAIAPSSHYPQFPLPSSPIL